MTDILAVPILNDYLLVPNIFVSSCGQNIFRRGEVYFIYTEQRRTKRSEAACAR